jgi:hypothetical protein
MSKYQLAQLNIGIARGAIDSPVMAEFVAQLDEINAIAESSPGFVWRLKDDGGNATSFRPLGGSVLVNMSVWEDAIALRNYVYRSAHSNVMRRRREWFEPNPEAALVLWWVPAGCQPTMDDAIARLTRLRSIGPTPEAFNFARLFPAPDAQTDLGAPDISQPCPAV